MKNSIKIYDPTIGFADFYWAKVRIKMATDPRRITTLRAIKEIFSSVPLITLRRVIMVFSRPYDEAIYELTVLSNEIRSRYLGSEFNVWIDLKAQFIAMNSAERDRLRQECLAEMAKGE